MKTKIFLVVFLLVLFLMLILNTGLLFKTTGYSIAVDEKDPEEVIANLYNAIDIAKQKGDYNCCIEPACTMCYLGHWKFDKRTCDCDVAMKEGRDEDVCPECLKGLEEGRCKSLDNSCDLKWKIKKQFIL